MGSVRHDRKRGRVGRGLGRPGEQLHRLDDVGGDPGRRRELLRWAGWAGWHGGLASGRADPGRQLRLTGRRLRGEGRPRSVGLRAIHRLSVGPLVGSSEEAPNETPECCNIPYVRSVLKTGIKAVPYGRTVVDAPGCAVALASFSTDGA